MVRWFVGSTLHGGPIELHLKPHVKLHVKLRVKLHVSGRMFALFRANVYIVINAIMNGGVQPVNKMATSRCQWTTVTQSTYVKLVIPP